MIFNLMWDHTTSQYHADCWASRDIQRASRRWNVKSKQIIAYTVKTAWDRREEKFCSHVCNAIISRIKVESDLRHVKKSCWENKLKLNVSLIKQVECELAFCWVPMKDFSFTVDDCTRCSHQIFTHHTSLSFSCLQ